MTDQRMRIPGPDHPITIENDDGRVRVVAGDRVIADTRRALMLTEAAYPAVAYIPREDIDMALLEPSATASYCPYKGEAAYFSIAGETGVRTDVAWSYPDAYPSVARIAGHLAFYPNRVDAIERTAQ